MFDRRLKLALLAAFGAALGCSFFTTSDDLIGPAPSVSTPTDAGEVPALDATTIDAAAPIDAAPATWCARNRPDARYCADFDDGRPLSALGIASGAVSIEAGVGDDASQALVVDIPDSSAAQSRAFITTIMSGAGRRYEAELTIRASVPGSSPYTEVGSMSFQVTGGRYALFVAINDSVTLVEQLGSDNGRLITELKLDPRAPLVLRVGLDTGVQPFAISLFVNETRVVDEPAQQAPTSLPPQAQLQYGVIYSGPTSTKQFIVDNVVFDLRD